MRLIYQRQRLPLLLDPRSRRPAGLGARDDRETSGERHRPPQTLAGTGGETKTADVVSVGRFG